MAQGTLLQLVSDEQIAALRKKPATIDKVKAPKGGTFLTYYVCSLSYFLTGSPYPKGHKLAPALGGKETVTTKSLNCGSFAVVPSADAKKLAALLAKVDVAAVEKKVRAADLDELVDEDVDDADSLADEDNPAKTVGAQIRTLAAFYEAAAKKGLGVVMYTE
jgi:hypothetical protein